MLAVQLISRLREQLGVEFALAEVFAHPGLAAQAAAVGTAARHSLPAIVPVPRDRLLPLSFAQQRLWFIGLQPQARDAYLLPSGLRLRGPLDRHALRQALDRIVARHEVLRTSVRLHDGHPVQHIAPATTGFPLRDRVLPDAADPEDAIAAEIAAETATPFDLTQQLPIRGCLLRLADDDHLLLVTLHHLAADAWSSGVLANEFSTLYSAFLQGLDDPLPPLPIQYADFAAWQRRWLDGERLQSSFDFWRTHLRGAPLRLALPTDRPRPPQQDYRGDVFGFALDAALSHALRSLSQHHGTTLFMTLLAGWAVLLSRLSGQQQVVIGTPVAGRDRGELEPLIGLFVNSLALQIDLRQDPTVAEVLQQVRTSTLAAQAHQQLPFEQVVEALNPERSTTHHPLFQVMFAWQSAPEGRLELPGLIQESVVLPTHAAQFNLELSMSEHDGRLLGSIGYATALFERASVERHIALFIATLRAMVADAKTPVARLRLLSDSGRVQLHPFNASAPLAGAAVPVHQLLERMAAQHPDAIALEDAARSFSYAELDRRANRLAHHLITRGIAPDRRVGLCMQRGADAIIAIFAVLKAGGAYVPLDPAYPRERLNVMLADSRPQILLADGVGQSALPIELETPVLRVDTAAAAWSDASPKSPCVASLQAAHLAYVMYTSGSSGQPKGVAVTHAGLYHYALAAARTYALTSTDRVLHCNSLSFDIAVDEIFVTLAQGATLVMSPDARLPAAAAFSRLLMDLRISVLNLPTAYWHAWVAEMAAGDASFPHGVRLVVSGGEAALAEAIGQWHALARGQVRWLNAYGPTETVCGVSFGEVAADARVHVGAPLAGLGLHVLDGALQPVPVDMVGELWIAGEQLARGYLDRPALTAERFLPDRFASAPGQRMYRSGDLARWRSNGVLELLGRNDAQVKLRGFRIELGEIESALRSCDGVREAVVVVRDAHSESRLVAYLVAHHPGLDLDQVRARLVARLPEYMLPSAYVQLDALPLTVNGKLDHAALPAPVDAERDGDAPTAVSPPQGAVEQALAALWSDLLEHAQVSRDDDFFALGGHSLLAVQLISRVRGQLGVELQIQDVFHHPQLHALAQRVANAAASSLPAIVAVDRDCGDPLPLSFAQQRLWFLAQLDPQAGLAYLMPNGLRLRGRLDRPALRQALDRLVARHETLRTRIDLHHDEPVQIIDPATFGFSLHEHDLAAQPDPTAALRTLADREATTTFALAEAPLVRGQLLRLGEDDHVLLVTLHHLIADGWSMDLLVHELSCLYTAFAQGQPDPLPPLPLQYADVAVWQRRWLRGELLQRQRDFWVAQLHDAPTLLELPVDRPRLAPPDHRGDVWEFSLDQELSSALKALSQRNGTTLFITLLTAWGALLARLAGQDEVVIGTPVANRTHRELEPLIGLFVNTIALRIDLRTKPSVAALLAQVRATALAAQQHQDLPFEQVIEACNPVRTLAYHPLFQVMFTWQEAPRHGATLHLPGLELRPVPQTLAALKFDLDLTLEERDGRIVGILGYAIALFDGASVQRMLQSFVHMLQAFVRDNAACIADLPWLPQTQRQQLLQDFNATTADLPPAATLVQALHAQVQRTPQATALIDGEHHLRYAQLWERASTLAAQLQRRGLAHGQALALILPRSAELVVAQL
ncbi:non-ribosomal peptide synthetase, partial [Xanthomonas maliensis]